VTPQHVWLSPDSPRRPFKRSSQIREGTWVGVVFSVYRASNPQGQRDQQVLVPMWVRQVLVRERGCRRSYRIYYNFGPDHTVGASLGLEPGMYVHHHSFQHIALSRVHRLGCVRRERAS
jgi:hypothetical protein